MKPKYNSNKKAKKQKKKIRYSTF